MFPTRTEGFSLIELMLVAALISVMAAITVPTVAAGLTRYQIISATQQVASTIRSARIQAVGKNQTLRVRFNAPAATQYQIVDAMDAAVGSVQALPTGVTFVAVSGDIEFNTSGRVTAVGGPIPITVVVGNGDADQNRTLTISPSGRVLVP